MDDFWYDPVCFDTLPSSYVICQLCNELGHTAIECLRRFEPSNVHNAPFSLSNWLYPEQNESFDSNDSSSVVEEEPLTDVNESSPHFFSTSNWYVDHLFDQLHCLQKLPSQSLKSYFLEARSLASALSMADAPISEIDLMNFIIDGLDPLYNKFVKYYYFRKPQISLDFLFDFLIDEEKQCMKPSFSTSKEASSLSTTPEYKSDVFKVCAQLHEVANEESSNSSVAPGKKEDSTKKAGPSAIADAATITAFLNQVSGLVELIGSRDIMESPSPQYAPQPQAAAPASPAPVPPPASAPALPAPAKPKSSHPLMKCPMAGTFYRSPAPGTPAFVKAFRTPTSPNASHLDQQKPGSPCPANLQHELQPIPFHVSQVASTSPQLSDYDNTTPVANSSSPATLVVPTLSANTLVVSISQSAVHSYNSFVPFSFGIVSRNIQEKYSYEDGYIFYPPTKWKYMPCHDHLHLYMRLLFNHNWLMCVCQNTHNIIISLMLHLRGKTMKFMFKLQLYNVSFRLRGGISHVI